VLYLIPTRAEIEGRGERESEQCTYTIASAQKSGKNETEKKKNPRTYLPLRRRREERRFEDNRVPADPPRKNSVTRRDWHGTRSAARVRLSKENGEKSPRSFLAGARHRREKEEAHLLVPLNTVLDKERKGRTLFHCQSIAGRVQGGEEESRGTDFNASTSRARRWCTKEERFSYPITAEQKKREGKAPRSATPSSPRAPDKESGLEKRKKKCHQFFLSLAGRRGKGRRKTVMRYAKVISQISTGEKIKFVEKRGKEAPAPLFFAAKGRGKGEEGRPPLHLPRELQLVRPKKKKERGHISHTTSSNEREGKRAHRSDYSRISQGK